MSNTLMTKADSMFSVAAGYKLVGRCLFSSYKQLKGTLLARWVRVQQYVCRKF